ncbi:mandelate racemase/muconate lactonizing enzyme family protein [Defluviimonas sp. WL0024]|uniref:Mandelate racemase/muconate lactonizing enzyme family protein n=1 Tax=Albidovulum salinarum TaxID=2984153 RepID=A0ABT2XEZ8_9RHOB|nr:mandelate racemase/muconate lactonizing enzyme family protein [Defluviimonas sp. WL0024]MCU9850255.1 mandelate racemase/muconate lactonizing enzyme family protein [Defluviimonas sp. WL0024]
MTVRIERVEVLCLQDPGASYNRFEGSYQNAVVVVHGDNGLCGIGESDTPPSVLRAIVEMPTYNSLAEGLGSILTGQELDDPRRLWDEMYRRTQWFGRHGAVLHAISALDIAIWDLFARSRGVPVHALLGGKRHDRLPVYATIYPLADTPDGITAQAEALRARGFRALKICVDPWWQDAPLVRLNLTHLRKVVGDACDLMLDVAQEFTRFDEIEGFLPLLEELDFKWIEAPFPLGSIADHARLRQKTRIPVGVGDLGFTTCREVTPFLDAGALDFVQPDVTMFGGLSEMTRLAAMLGPRRIVPHGYNSDITIAANLQFLSTRLEPELVEYSTSPALLRNRLAVGLAPVGEDGMIAVPDTPGLGVALNPEVVTCTRQVA